MVAGAKNAVLAAGALLLGLSGCLHQGQPVISERAPDLPRIPDRAPVTRPSTAPPPATPIPVTEQSQSAAKVRRDVAASPGVDARRSLSYLVRPGDTLYSIAWRFNLDPDGLARANEIQSPYTIYPGQRLRLQEKAAPRARASQATNPPAQPVVTAKRAQRWVWPLPMTPTRGFSAHNKGVDFSVPSGQGVRVRAGSDGTVVYAGNGIGGYERLIIIRHSDDLLSAYSFNGRLRVAEQERVKVGQEIAALLPLAHRTQSLHFEIRSDGDPVNPGRFIP